jgi:hypothetical protein
MTITFKNDNDVIVYALETVISYARRTQQIFVAQRVWWLASIIGLEEALVTHVDILHGRTTVRKEHTTKEARDSVIPTIPETQGSEVQKAKENHQDKILKECVEYLKDSRRLREVAALKATGKTLTGLINPTAISKKFLRKKDCHKRKSAELPSIHFSNISGIDEAEIKRRKENGECLRCTWPSDTNGPHRVKQYRRPIKLDKGTASFGEAKRYQGHLPKEASDAGISLDSSSDDSIEK